MLQSSMLQMSVQEEVQLRSLCSQSLWDFAYEALRMILFALSFLVLRLHQLLKTAGFECPMRTCVGTVQFVEECFLLLERLFLGKSDQLFLPVLYQAFSLQILLVFPLSYLSLQIFHRKTLTFRQIP